MNRNDLKKYYDSRSACQVIGGIIANPNLLRDRRYSLSEEDFKDNIHKATFATINNLILQGVKSIGMAEIETYVANVDPVTHKRLFEDEKNKEWLYMVIEDANASNFEYHYNIIKKFSLMRSYIEQGINVADILDMTCLDITQAKQQRDGFNAMELEDIIKIMDKRMLDAKRGFVIGDASDNRKIGDNADSLREKMKESPQYGLNLESGYLNTITRGVLGKKVLLETRDSGMGKTRICLKRLLNIAAPYVWDYKKENFVPNPNGQDNAVLYIGTEMDLYEELDPMAWAFLSGVEEHKIKDCNLTQDEEYRLDRAIEILQETKLYMVNEPNYSIRYLWQVIEEYKVKYNICAVGLDYIELTADLVSEYVANTKGMGAREDQVLLSLSTNLKNIAERFNIFINAFTQTTDEARRDGIRDQRAVKGARSLPNKVDVGIVSFEPTKKELEKLEPIISHIGLATHRYPNICYSFYKNRGGRIKNVRVWGYQDLGNMYYKDLFCTDHDLNKINIDQTWMNLLED